jgi:hypothetical protein
MTKYDEYIAKIESDINNPSGSGITPKCLTLSEHLVDDIDISTEFNDVDDHIMTSAAILDKIIAQITAELINGQPIDVAIDSLILTHKNIAAAHHAKYTNAEAIAAVVAGDPLSLTNGLEVGGVISGYEDVLPIVIKLRGTTTQSDYAHSAWDFGTTANNGVQLSFHIIRAGSYKVKFLAHSVAAQTTDFELYVSNYEIGDSTAANSWNIASAVNLPKATTNTMGEYRSAAYTLAEGFTAVILRLDNSEVNIVRVAGIVLEEQ